jgi:ParB-like chromosome segregation protein Spo0J
MNHKIDPSLKSLAVDIDSLIPLPGNPRRGDVDAIAVSYDEFGQVKPVVIRPNDDGTATVIAGNHQVEAAKKLGWTHIAAVPMEADDNRAITFALTDNRVSELGETDEELLKSMILDVDDDYFEILEGLGWDEFEISVMEISREAHEQIKETGSGYVPPVIVNPDPIKNSAALESNNPESRKIEAPKSLDQGQAVISGASQSVSNAPKIVVQYNLVFDDQDQQRRFYDFLKWLRSDPGNDGDSTAEKLIMFLEGHADF